MLRKMVLILLISTCVMQIQAQKLSETEIPFLENEYWWGAFVARGSAMPYIKPIQELNLETQNFNNQGVPLFLSNKGRYVWSNKPFRFEIKDNKLIIRSQFDTAIQALSGGKTLRDAYRTACAKHFPPSGQLPDSLLFSMPQYNTWIELMYNQNQEDIEKYAADIIRNNFPPGVLMIDDNWQRYYGNYDFKSERFPNPKGMVDKLHNMGFKVMLWVSPYISPDSPEFRELEAKGMLAKRKSTNQTALVRWWNGYSALYDLTNPQTVEYVVAKLRKNQKDYGIDGFKFDGGDVSYCGTDIVGFDKEALATDHLTAWAKIGLHFPFNEYRACWKMGGEALVQRLGDKDYSWQAVSLLVPDMIAAGLLGYAYTCPDMIGGGQYGSFLNVNPAKFDQQLIVRSAQTHALMPMMQFSVAPWRILDQKHLAISCAMAHLHTKMGPYILNCAREAAKTGEPIVRHMEYMYPNQGFATCRDQYMLGERYMVAPVVTPQNTRTINLPKGRWKDDMGKIHKGGKQITINVDLERLPYFEKIK